MTDKPAKRKPNRTNRNGFTTSFYLDQQTMERINLAIARGAATNMSEFLRKAANLWCDRILLFDE